MSNTKSTLTLQRNVQFIYEGHLAAIELQAFGCDRVQPSATDWKVFSAHVNGNSSALVNRSAYFASVDQKPTVYQSLIRPAYQGGKFNRTRSVNQYLTHWIYPYRGKFHPQMVRGLLNILGVQANDTICEPFLGSGTTALEASLLGINCVGVDLSPLCVMLSRVKTRSWSKVGQIRRAVDKLLSRRTLRIEDMPGKPAEGDCVGEFLEIARMVTLSDVARRGRESSIYLRKNLAAMLESIEAHARAVKRFKIDPGTVTARVGDARHLAASGIASNSIDGIVTSPPYSIALDYVKNDKHALEAMDVNMKDLSQVMTGVRGQNAKDKLALYNADMKSMFSEVMRVLKPGARAAFVIGDATVDRKEVTTTDEMAAWARATGLREERSIAKIVFGLYSVMLDEKILVFRKP